MKIKVADIVIRKRKREPSEDDILSLATSIEDTRLINPITLRDGNVLVAGLTRLRAHELLERDEIEVTMFEDLDVLVAEKMEIDENLQRIELNKLQECQQVLRRREIWEDENGEIKSGPVSGSRVSSETELTFIEMMCRLLGKRKVMVYEIIKVAQDLDTKVQETIFGLDICQNRAELKRLSEFPDDSQREIAAQLESGEITKVPQWDADVEAPFDDDDEYEYETDEPEYEENDETENDETKPTEPGEPGRPAAPETGKPKNVPWNKAVNIAIREIKKETVHQLNTLDEYEGKLAGATRSQILYRTRSITDTLSNLKD